MPRCFHRRCDLTPDTSPLRYFWLFNIQNAEVVAEAAGWLSHDAQTNNKNVGELLARWSGEERWARANKPGSKIRAREWTNDLNTNVIPSF